MAENWFAYTGGDVFYAGNYRLIDGIDPTTICTIGCVICAIKLDDNSDFPASIPGSVKQYLLNALVTRVPQPDFPNKFVILKPC
ncbi:hypothetical protein [Pedobacter gandavensis]|uniref:hypothetical protein n=1 Tax=Pedobacter gandavensis TaxID=2679963 RepID=UPI00292E4BAC|nr:hypothetical protein [Pedobacter gandavensis]